MLAPSGLEKERPLVSEALPLPFALRAAGQRKAGLAVPYPLSLIPYPLSLIPYPLSLIPYPLSLIPYPLSLIPYPLSLIPSGLEAVPSSPFGKPLALSPRCSGGCFINPAGVGPATLSLSPCPSANRNPQAPFRGGGCFASL
jgi:hypothetical protein